MRKNRLAGALALAAALMPAAAMADDPNDPVLSHSAAARARDRAIIRKLNRQELAHVQKRDARYAEGWRAWLEAHDDGSQGSGESAYARERQRYEREMAQWRAAVAACRAGDYSACGN